MKNSKIYSDNFYRKLLGLDYLLPKDDLMYSSSNYSNTSKADIKKPIRKYMIKKMPNFFNYELQIIAKTSHRMQKPA